MKINKEIDLFLDEVCGHIRFRDSHKEVRLELTDHILEIFDQHVEDGMNEKDAIMKSINSMGQPGDIGSRLNKVHKGAPDLITIILTLSFSIIGIFLMFLLKDLSTKTGFHYSKLFYKNIFYLLLGAIPATALFYFDFRKLKKYSIHIFALTASLCLFFTNFATIYYKGRAVWMFPLIGIDFMRVAPFLFIIASAGILSDERYKNDFRIKTAALFIPFFLMMNAPSPSASLLYCIGFSAITVSDFKKEGVAKFFIGLPILGELAAAWHFWRSGPVLVEFSSQSDSIFSYSPGLIQKIMHSAGWFGHGSISIETYFPELHSEFTMAFILNAFGWIGFAAVTSLFIVYMARLFSISKSIVDPYGKLIFSGALAIIVTEFSYNIMMNLNFLPRTDLILPFISYNTGSLISHLACMGLFLSIYRRRGLSLA